MLESYECYKVIKKLNISSVIKILDKLEFINSDGVCAWVTKPGSQAPKELLQLVQSLNLGGTTYRLFCRKLLPGQNILPHVDNHDWIREKNIRRFQIPLVSDPNIKMKWPDANIEVYLEPGYLYEVRYNCLHEVVNKSDSERIHIQIDQMNATI